jgi:hypothetical protein
MKNTTKTKAVKPLMQLTSVYCEADTLNLCRSRFGTIRAALNYAANQTQTKPLNQ